MPPFMRHRLRVFGIVAALGWLGFLIAMVTLSVRPSPWRLIFMGSALMAALLPYARFIARRRCRVRLRLIAARGRMCFRCGYDLCGLGDAGACPECGEAFVLEALRERWAASRLCTRSDLGATQEHGPARSG